MQDKTALVVDDSRVARITLGRMLASQGFDVTEKDSAEEAISYLQSQSIKPAVVFMDVVMTGMNGLTAVRQIKAEPALQDIPLIICTGNDTDADRDDALAAGAMSVLSKPPATEAIVKIVDKIATPVSTMAEQPLPEQVAMTLSTNMLEDIKQTLLPELQLQLRHMAEDISQQVARDTADEAVQAQINKLLPSFKEQLTDFAQHTSRELKQSFAHQTNEMMAKSAERSIERAVEAYSLTEKIKVIFHSDCSQWLESQRQQVLEQTSSQLSLELEGMISRYLDAHLMGKIIPILKSNLNEMKNESEQVFRERDEVLSKRITQLMVGTVIATVTAVSALVMVFF